MTSYNVAVTVGPNIFREEVEKEDLSTHAVYYEVFIKMLDDYFFIFDDYPET